MHLRVVVLFLCPLYILPDLVCYRQWYLSPSQPQPAPRRCPPGDWLFYYECCGALDDCCQRWRIELIIVVCIVLVILILCCCCCILGMIFRKKRKSEKVENTNEKEDYRLRTTEV